MLFLCVACDDYNYPWTIKYKITYTAGGTSNHFIIRYEDENGQSITSSTTQWTYEYKDTQHKYLSLNITNLDTTPNTYVEGDITVSNGQNYHAQNNMIVDLSGFVK